MKTLCVVKDVTIYADGDKPRAVVFELVGDDREDDSIDNADHLTAWGCAANAMVHCAGTNGGCLFPAKDVNEGMRIWLDSEELIHDLIS
jgi:hypothetical protein